ncbi:MAG TPA: hypothetical protein VF173_00330, partial [Thermoanaerobaculia bacterium]|nr:hypothetical protein [Thermoanaerobaculia bacterium]
ITSSARGISDTDVVVGWTRWPADNTAPQSAFKWNGGVVTLLSPNQQSLYSHFSEAFGINRQGGHIAGWVEKANESSIYAESWNGSTTGVHIFSDSLLNSTYWGGAFEGKANAVNNSDRIVGYCNTDPGTSPSGPHAFVAAGGSITDLNTCLYLNANWQALVEAKAINDHTNANGSPAGQIVGFGTTSSGATHAFLFTPP